jgi:hypothetical protein
VSETLTYYAFPDIHWQEIRTRAEHARDSSADPCRWSVPRRPVMPQPGGRTTPLHRRHSIVCQVLHEHATAFERFGTSSVRRSSYSASLESGRPGGIWQEVKV